MRKISQERIDSMEVLATRAFNSAKELYERAIEPSYVRYEDVREQDELFRKADYLLNRVMMLGDQEYERLIYVLVLSVKLSTWASKQLGLI